MSVGRPTAVVYVTGFAWPRIAWATLSQLQQQPGTIDLHKGRVSGTTLSSSTIH